MRYIPIFLLIHFFFLWSAFYDIVERYVPPKMKYKHLPKKTRAAIICKFKKTNPCFPACIGDWALVYLMRCKINIIRMYTI